MTHAEEMLGIFYFEYHKFDGQALFPLVSSTSNVSMLTVSEVMLLTKPNPTATNSDGVKEQLQKSRDNKQLIHVNTL